MYRLSLAKNKRKISKTTVGYNNNHLSLLFKLQKLLFAQRGYLKVNLCDFHQATSLLSSDGDSWGRRAAQFGNLFVSDLECTRYRFSVFAMYTRPPAVRNYSVELQKYSKKWWALRSGEIQWMMYWFFELETRILENNDSGRIFSFYFSKNSWRNSSESNRQCQVKIMMPDEVFFAIFSLFFPNIYKLKNPPPSQQDLTSNQKSSTIVMIGEVLVKNVCTDIKKYTSW